MSIETVSGACHCGAVTYTAEVDLGEPTIRCNCSICTKSRAWLAPIPPESFALLTGSDALTEYRFGGHVITHCFCARCGIKTHGRLRGADGRDSLVAVCVATLDLSPQRLAEIPVVYADGRNDDLGKSPDHTRYL